MDVIRASWGEVCDDAGMKTADREAMWGRQFFNPYAFEGWDEA
jgi:serine/threonine-protein kinase HipA